MVLTVSYDQMLVDWWCRRSSATKGLDFEGTRQLELGLGVALKKERRKPFFIFH